MKPTLMSALAEPNRMHMIELLRDGPRTVNEIVERLGLPQPLVSKHLRVLRNAQLVQVRPQAQTRLYQLQPRPLAELDAWLGPFRRLWEGRLDSLDDYLQEMKKSSSNP